VHVPKDCLDPLPAGHVSARGWPDNRPWCARRSTLVRHIDRRLDRKFGWQPEILFNARAGELLHRRGNMDTELNYQQAREHFRIDPLIRTHINDPDFPSKIRPTERQSPPSRRSKAKKE
jgi:hypothetical protein